MTIFHRKVRGELVQFASESGLLLDGFLFDAVAPKGVVLHVHGSYGNFYHNRFLCVLGESYAHVGWQLFTFNLSARGGFDEGYYSDERFDYVGGALQPFRTTEDDIQAALTLCTSIAPAVVLEGHSLGCDRVVHFAAKRSFGGKLILLSPCDSHALQSDWISPETVEQQRVRLESTPIRPWDWLPLDEYGIKADEWTYPIPITRAALIELLDSPVFRLFRADDLSLQVCIENDAIVYIGGDDRLQTMLSGEMIEVVRRRVPRAELLLIPGGDHSLSPYEHQVGNALSRWVADRQ